MTSTLFSNSQNPKGIEVASQVLTLYSADSLNPGAVNTINQSYAGVKTFNNGIVLGTGYTPGLDSNTLILYAVKSYNPVPVTFTGLVGAADIVLTLIVAGFGVQMGFSFGTYNLPVPSLISVNTIIPVEFRPGSSQFGTLTVVNNGGAFQTGGFLVTPAGQITIGKGISIVGPSLIPFDAGTAQIVIGQTNYTKY